MGKLRFLMVFLVVLLATGLFMTRNFMNMAIVSMVQFENTADDRSSLSFMLNEWGASSNFLLEVPRTNESTDAKHSHFSDAMSRSGTFFDSIATFIEELSVQRFRWSNSVIARLQGAFFLGYIFLQLQSASLAERHGGANLLLLSVFASSIVALLGPFFTRNEWIFIFARFICGLAQSCFLPAAFVLLMNWLPKQERTLGVTALTTSLRLGTVIIYFASGFITTGLGWPFIFWVAGAYGLLTSIIGYAFLYSEPQEHPSISREELIHIKSDPSYEKSIPSAPSSVQVACSESTEMKEINGKEDHKEGENKENVKARLPVPWMKILKNKSFIAIFLLKVVKSFAISFDGSFNPIFIKTIVGLSTEMTGIVNAASPLIYILTAFPVTMISERIIKNNSMSRTRLRRTSAWIDSLGQATCRMLIPCAMMYGSTPMYLCLVAISGLLSGFAAVAEGPITQEMSKNFGHSIYALLNLSTVVASVLYPSIISLILELNGNSRLAWFIVQWLIGGLTILSAIPYGFWASCERQSFDIITAE